MLASIMLFYKYGKLLVATKLLELAGSTMILRPHISHLIYLKFGFWGVMNSTDFCFTVDILQFPRTAGPKEADKAELFKVNLTL